MSEGADKALTIAINSKVELQGFMRAMAAMQQNIGAAKALGKSTADLELQYSRAQTALEEYRKKTKDAGEDVDELEIHHRTLRQAMSVIGPEGQEMSEMLIGAMEGPIGMVIVAGAAMKLLTESFAQAAEKARALREAQSELTTEVWTSQRDAANEASEAAAKYADNLERIFTAHEKVSTAETSELAILRAKIEAQAELLKAQEAAELAAANGDKLQEEEVKRRYGAKTSQATLAGEANTIAKQSDQLLNRTVAAHGLKEKADADETAYEAAVKSHQAAADNPKLKQLVDEQAPLDKAAGEFNLPDLREKLKTAATISGEGGGRSDYEIISDQIEEGEKAAKAAEDNRAKVDALNAVVEQEKQSVERAKNAADKSADAFKENAEAMQALTEKIKEAKAILDLHRTTADTVKGIEAPATPFGKALQSERGDAIKIATGHADQVNADSQKLITDLGALIAGHTVTLQQAARLIASADANNTNFMNALAAMAKTSESMRTFSQDTAAKLQDIYREIDHLTQLIRGTHNR